MCEWRISPYPDGFDWAFTIVHDADDAYSARLAPILDSFDSYGVKATLTAFSFWDTKKKQSTLEEISRGSLFEPKCVPLEYAPECEFYRTLIERGHEVGMHTASDGHDTRKTVVRAFEFYKKVFGFFPAIYVEHRDNHQNMQQSGSDPSSEYFLIDILNFYRPWVWIVSPSAIPYAGLGRYYDVLSSQKPLLGWMFARLWGSFKEFLKFGTLSRANGYLYELLRRGGSPYDTYAKIKFGLNKAFRRSGRQEKADGDGFVEWYCNEHLDDLDARGGLAIVYTHLNSKWLDEETMKIRKDIEERLSAISSYHVWLETASNILNRFKLIDDLILVVSHRFITIVNPNNVEIKGLTIISKNSKKLYRNSEMLTVNSRGKIVLGDINPLETIVLNF
jgi:hypothetical protein